MKAYYGKIEKLTKDNNFFRQVLWTGKYCQLVVMSLKPGEEIGLEVHDKVDQFFRVEEGEAKFIINGEEYAAKDGDAVIVPAGAQHNVVSTGSEDLKLYTIYSPANHPDGTVHKTKQQALEAEEHEQH
ncbi:cupin [Candidatus Beckwithbacteria bacterium RBG_13_35_6]|uniref:Cupin n=1 Tax=Candidatus Beckwithbacteria bacterium RBG_13_35_6 TaxID=1797456 RepID=A0A1F5DCG2_9BACT|nr:MAG: cupin [Candidatus Beckwithbacteria bacterium RBG_13_35_6]